MNILSWLNTCLVSAGKSLLWKIFASEMPKSPRCSFREDEQFHGIFSSLFNFNFLCTSCPELDGSRTLFVFEIRYSKHFSTLILLSSRSLHFQFLPCIFNQVNSSLLEVRSYHSRSLDTPRLFLAPEYPVLQEEQQNEMMPLYPTSRGHFCSK